MHRYLHVNVFVFNSMKLTDFFCEWGNVLDLIDIALGIRFEHNVSRTCVINSEIAFLEQNTNTVIDK